MQMGTPAQAQVQAQVQDPKKIQEGLQEGKGLLQEVPRLQAPLWINTASRTMITHCPEED